MSIGMDWSEVDLFARINPTYNTSVAYITLKKGDECQCSSPFLFFNLALVLFNYLAILILVALLLSLALMMTKYVPFSIPFTDWLKE